jgi:hypothetical protein
MTDPIGGVATGLGTRGIWEFGRYAVKRVTGWRYKRVFGKDAFQGNLHLVYALLNPPIAVDAAGNKVKWIFTRPGDLASRFSMSAGVSVCEMRAVTYLAESVASNTGSWIRLASADELSSRDDLSYISLGVKSNDKTMALLYNTSNLLVDFNESVGRFVIKGTDRTIVAPSTDPKIDYGMILKIHPTAAPERDWICCGGYGEWGTSGAASYLIRKWKEISKEFGRGPFVIFVQVEQGHDEAADRIIGAATLPELHRQAKGP